MDFFFQILVLIMSIVIHETSHGYAARYLGDHTAEYEGRLTLNPLKHLDPVGSFLIPLASYTLGGFLIGWAKPVPYNPFNLRPGRWSEAIVAGAGPLSNISIALVFSLILRGAVSSGATQAFVEMAGLVVFINLILAVFNLMPVPPLDGSKLLFALFPQKFPQFRTFFERYGLALLIFFVFFLWQLIFPIVEVIFRLFTGLNL